MAVINATAYYREQQITTASRGQLLLMVYDGMLRSLAEAQRAMSHRRYEEQNTSIQKVQELLMELLNTLDYQVYPELASNLDRLYRYLYDQLTHANIHDDETSLNTTFRFIRELRDAWMEADKLASRRDVGQLASTPW